MEECLNTIKLIYEPSKEIHTNKHHILEDIEDLEPPAMTAEDFVAHFRNVPDGSPANFEEFQIIEVRARARTKRRFIRSDNLAACCQHHGFISPTQKAQVEQALINAEWERGTFDHSRVWRHD